MNAYAYPVLNMRDNLGAMHDILSDFTRGDVVSRIWHKDHTVWKPDPTEISDRLGWLYSIDAMNDRVQLLDRFAGDVSGAGFRHVVLLGMGGSSLGPEVLKRTFSNSPGYPELTVLDSTVPAAIQGVAKSVDLSHTLFLVSSKSGTTTETTTLYTYFRSLIEKEVGRSRAGAHFVAITDPGTPLESVAKSTGFRHCFTNSPDIGGRYSVLSYFGLVPAALLGMNLKDLLYKAGQMQERCAACANVEENPGVWPGVLLAACARGGRDKLTLIVSPSIASFGLWLEQLIAESTGKEGKGIIPVIDEPPAYPTNYGRDRVFVYLRSNKDDNAKLDGFVEQLEISGQPIIQLHMDDSSYLGAEFFRWEMITAVAGVVLGVNPFDQPDVQCAKDATKATLREGKGTTAIVHQPENPGLSEFMAGEGSGRYLAVLLYLRQIPSLDRAIRNLRADVMRRYKIATTAGYGPRYLHSTGQLHKGGPATGMFVEVVATPRGDLGVPGLPYSFGELTRAAAEGDYRVLKERGRPVIRVELNTATGAAFERTLRVF